MYNLIEHNNNFSKTSESFFQYWKDKPALNDDDSIVDFANDNNNTHCVKWYSLQPGPSKIFSTSLVNRLNLICYSNFYFILHVPLVTWKILFHFS